MSQASYTTPSSPLTMTALKTFLDNALAALASIQRGDPAGITSPTEGMLCWDNTGVPDVLKRYTAEAGWVSLLTVNVSTGAVTVSDVTLNALATGFTVAGGTTSRTLTVDISRAISDLLLADGSNLAIGSNADGDTYYRASGKLARRAKGTAGQVWTMNAEATAPIWSTIPANAAAGTPSLRKLGTGATDACAGNDSRLSDSRTPVNSSVSQVKLKTSTGAVSVAETDYTLLTLPGGQYAFYPQIKMNFNNVMGSEAQVLGGSNYSWTSYATTISLRSGHSDCSIYAQSRYVTSSGEIYWIFILRDKIDKRIKAMYRAPDHPCFGNGGKPLLVPHPFVSCNYETDEIIVINPSDEEIFEMQSACIMPEDKPDRDMLEVITEDYEIDEDLQTDWPTKEVTVGLPQNADWKYTRGDTDITPIKKRIPKPDYITTRKLWSRRWKNEHTNSLY